MAHMAALRREASQVPVPTTLADAETSGADSDPKLALPALATKEHGGQRTFWQVEAPRT